jgi:hypothetical protein
VPGVGGTLQRWYRYEFENTMLPLPLQSEMQQNQIVGYSLSCCTQLPAVWWMWNAWPGKPSIWIQRRRHLHQLIKPKPTIPQNTLEYRLPRVHFNEPSTPRSLKNCHPIHSKFALVGIERLFQHTRTPVSPALWLLLKNVGNVGVETVVTHCGTDGKDHSMYECHRLPGGRRQKRSSYAVAGPVGRFDTVNAFRQELLDSQYKDAIAVLVQKLENEGGFNKLIYFCTELC